MFFALPCVPTIFFFFFSYGGIVKGFDLFGHDPGVIPVPNTGPPHPSAYHEPDHSFYDDHFLHADGAYKKTDAVSIDRGARAKLIEPLPIDDIKPVTPDATTSPKKTGYTYFNVRTAKALEPEMDTKTEQPQQQRRSDVWLHPTTATFKDKRIAGVSNLLLFFAVSFDSFD